MTYDIAIIGGGIMGCAAAYFLARSGRAGSVCVIEPDPSYQHATTPQGAGGIRQQFSVAENIEMSRFSLSFYKNLTAELSDIPDLPDLNFRELGYLFLVTESGAETLRRNQALQDAHGVQADLLSYDEVRRRFPSIKRDDIALGCHTPDDGWIDPNAGPWCFRRAAEHLGIHFVKARVTGIDTDPVKVRALRLDTGERLTADFFINTAGPWVAPLAAMTGADLPIEPMCRVQHFWKCADALEPLPLIKDESGMFFRPEGDGFAGGRPTFDIAPGFVDDIYSGFFRHLFRRHGLALAGGAGAEVRNPQAAAQLVRPLRAEPAGWEHDHRTVLARA